MRTSPISLLIGTAVAVAVGFTARAEGVGMRVATIPYDECLAIIVEAAKEVGEEPVNLAETAERRIARIDAADGFVTISCWRADKLMTLTKSAVPAAVGTTASH